MIDKHDQKRQDEVVDRMFAVSRCQSRVCASHIWMSASEFFGDRWGINHG